MSTIRVDFNVLNQKGTPALYSDGYANRPAAGYGGRLFISTDTHQIFQDVITGWNLIADTGSGSSNLDQVTANGNSTTHGINILGGDLTLQSSQKLYVIGLANGGVLFPSSGSGLIDQDTTNFVWDNTNKRLGLGTATPGVRLDIHSSTGVNAQFNGTGVTNATLQMQNAGTSKWTLGNYYNGGNNDFNIYDNVNASYRAYFLNTGYAIFPNSVIIGSSSRSSSYGFDVTGNSSFTGTIRNTGAAYFATSSGNVGVGTTNPNGLGNGGTQATLEVFKTGGNGYLSLTTDLTADGSLTGVVNFGSTGSAAAGKSGASIQSYLNGSGATYPSSDLVFYTRNGATFGERLRITSSGNVLINSNTFYNGNFSGSASGLNINTAVPICLLRESSSGNTFYMGLSGSAATLGTQNAIALTFSTSDIERMRITSGGQIQIGGTSNTYIDYTTNTARFYGGTSTNTFGLGANNSIFFQGDASQFYPTADNTRALGAASYRYTTVYATTALINTSDFNDKEQIEDLTQLEKNVSIKLKGLVKKFKFKDAVALKGDNARIHIGVIAQEVEQAFIEQGLDANKYGLFCSDTWYELDGILVDKNTENATEKTKLGIRYEELIIFIISQI